MGIEELRTLTREELESKLEDLHRQLMELNFQRKTTHVEKPHLFKRLRKEIARILTVIQEKRRKNEKKD